MDKVKALKYFHRVAELSSFSLAAAAFDLPPSSLSRRVKDLENSLGVELLKRSTRHVSLTELGKLYYDKTTHALKEIEYADELVSQQQGVMKGILRISATASYGEKVLMPILQEFNKTYPDIIFQLDFNDKLVNFDKDSVDIAIRASSYPDSRVVAKQLSQDTLVPVITPFLLKKIQQEYSQDILSLQTLQQCPIVHYESNKGIVSWYYKQAEKWLKLDVDPVLVSNSGNSLLAWVLASKGIALFPTWWIGKYLSDNQLVTLPIECEVSSTKGQPLDMYILYPQAKYQVPKIKTCVDFIIEHLK